MDVFRHQILEEHGHGRESHGRAGPSRLPPGSGALRAALLALLLGSLLPGCARQAPPGGLPQAYYQTAFPVHDTSRDLERAHASVRRIAAEATYQTLVFSRETAPTEAELRAGAGFSHPPDTVIRRDERSASAILLARRGRRITLLSVNHAIHFPDSILEFFTPEEGLTPAPAERRVERLSIRTFQVFRIFGLPGMATFQVLARDEWDDLALLGMELPRELVELESEPLPVPSGDARRLSWGSFVYVLGFPRGYPMVTRGIVSSPEGDASGSFLVDGLWNRGMSGGLILAIRGDGSGMEWVGMARAAAAVPEVQLRPEPLPRTREELGAPYRGPILLEEVRQIQYGITLSVPMGTIRRFVEEHRGTLEEAGFPIPGV